MGFIGFVDCCYVVCWVVIVGYCVDVLRCYCSVFVYLVGELVMVVVVVVVILFVVSYDGEGVRRS